MSLKRLETNQIREKKLKIVRYGLSKNQRQKKRKSNKKSTRWWSKWWTNFKTRSIRPSTCNCSSNISQIWNWCRRSWKGLFRRRGLIIWWLNWRSWIIGSKATYKVLFKAAQLKAGSWAILQHHRGSRWSIVALKAHTDLTIMDWCCHLMVVMMKTLTSWSKLFQNWTRLSILKNVLPSK